MNRFLISLFALVFFTLTASSEEQTAPDTLTVGVKTAPPFLMKENGTWTGASIDLWESISEKLGYNYVYKEFNLEDLTTALSNEEIDLTINPLTVTADRSHKFLFTQPFYISYLTVAVPAGSEQFIGGFLKNFFSVSFFKALFGLIMLILIFGLIIWLAEKHKNPSMFKKGWMGVADGFWWSAVTMTTVGYGDKAPVTPLGRIFGFIWMFTAVIVISGFTASIASSLTVNKINYSIESIHDLRDVSVASIEGSSSSNFLSNQGIEHYTYKSLDEAINEIKNRKYAALVYDDAILQYSIARKNLDKSIDILPLKFNKQYYAFAFPYTSDISFKINTELLHLLENPVWEEILNRYKIKEK
ncbi:MAG: transporter substrate-binding domain-containing protein [Bacteroidales bacterium]